MQLAKEVDNLQDGPSQLLNYYPADRVVSPKTYNSRAGLTFISLFMCQKQVVNDYATLSLNSQTRLMKSAVGTLVGGRFRGPGLVKIDECHALKITYLIE